MTDLRALKERIDAATEPDRDIDRDLLDALGIEVREFDPGDGDVSQWRVWSDETRVENTHVSASIDAALALVERVLPGPKGSVIVGMDHRDHTCIVGLGANALYGFPSYVAKRSDNPLHVPLAILSALLAALIAQEEG